MIERVLTIGAYGFTTDAFLDKLKSAGADLFVDIRARRGMRGSAYAFANATRLQSLLSASGIRYVHAKALAPSDSIRKLQRDSDADLGVEKRIRGQLCKAFVNAYNEEYLANFDSSEFLARFCVGARRPVFFCVEKNAIACHRSLVSVRIAKDFGVTLEDLAP